jgi:hypothetical protein
MMEDRIPLRHNRGAASFVGGLRAAAGRAFWRGCRRESMGRLAHQRILPAMTAPGLIAVWALCILNLNGQTAVPQASGDTVVPWSGSIRGQVSDSATGAPVEGVRVVTSGSSGRREATTDRAGHYTLDNLPAGHYVLSIAKLPDYTLVVKQRTLQAGGDPVVMNVRLEATATFAGRVLDQDGAPLQGATVQLVQMAYTAGRQIYFFGGTTHADDLGRYRIAAQAGATYFLLAIPALVPKFTAMAPGKSLQRERAVRTFYPNATALEAAIPVTARSGAPVEGLDIKVASVPTYCAQADVTLGGAGRAYVSLFEVAGKFHKLIAAAEASSRLYACGLPPASYKWFASSGLEGGAAQYFGTAEFTIGERDVNRISVSLQPALSLAGEARWDGDQQPELKDQRAGIWTMPLDRDSFYGENREVRFATPGRFTLSGLSDDDYSFDLFGLGGGLYVKSATAGTHDLFREPLSPGRLSGGAISLVIARDGGTITASTKDKDGKPVPDRFVTALPENSPDVPYMLGARWSCQTDQDGACAIGGLAPGKYYVFSGYRAADTPAERAKLWQNHIEADEVIVGAGQTVNKALEVESN